MKILSLELKHYSRFSLNGITEFKLTATSKLQYILGTNGSGKSSLLEALSPYPQSKNDFLKGGFRILVIEHNNIDYTLTSEYKSGARHSFMRDGEELNDGGTGAVQKELVESIFGFSSDMHQLLTGSVTFTEMGPSERREWLSRISTVDVHYATKLYDMFKKDYRDVQGALKYAQIRLAKETEKVVDDSKVAELDQQMNDLQNRINFLMENKTNTIKNSAAMKLLDNANNAITTASNRIFSAKLSHPNMQDLTSIEKINEAEGILCAEISTDETMIKAYEDKLSDNELTLKQLVEEGAVNLQGLEKKLGILHEAESMVDQYYNGFTIEGDLQQVLADTRSLRVVLSELVAPMKGSDLCVPDRDQWTLYRDKLTALEGNMISSDGIIISLNNRKNEIENAYENTCPKCKYIWKPGISENELKDINEKINASNADNALIAKELERYRITCENIDIRRSEIMSFKDLSRQYPRLNVLWRHIAEKDFISTTPWMILEIYQKWSKAVDSKYRMDNLQKEIDSVEVTIEKIKAVNDHADVKFFTREQDKLNNAISNARHNIRKEYAELKVLRHYKKDYLELKSNFSDMVDGINNLQQAKLTVFESSIQEFGGKALAESQIQLASIKQKLIDIKTSTDVIKDLKKSIETYKHDEDALSALVRTLSPSEGLIGDALQLYANRFVGQLNDMISSVWEYDLTIQACNLDGDAMDYKFPLVVNNGEKIVPDINKGSDGQREIINFAFMLSVIINTGLTDFPLFLDELGSTFDESHRRNLLMYINRLLESNQCSQIWMVSHFAADHSGMASCETCVLDATNIAVPEKYNEHVFIG